RLGLAARATLQRRQFLGPSFPRRIVVGSWGLELTFAQLHEVLVREDIERGVAGIILLADDFALAEAAQNDRAREAFQLQALQVDVLEQGNLLDLLDAELFVAVAGLEFGGRANLAGHWRFLFGVRRFFAA